VLHGSQGVHQLSEKVWSNVNGMRFEMHENVSSRRLLIEQITV